MDNGRVSSHFIKTESALISQEPNRGCSNSLHCLLCSLISFPLPRLSKLPVHRYSHEPSCSDTTSIDIPPPRRRNMTGHHSMKTCTKSGRGADDSRFENNLYHMAYKYKSVGVDKKTSPNTVNSSQQSTCLRPCRSTTVNDSDLQTELQQLSESTAKLKVEVKERTELLRYLRGMRARVIAEGEKLGHSGPFGAQGTSSVNRGSSPSSPSTSAARPTSFSGSSSGISEARKACLEAYAKMTPAQRHLMKEKLHQEGVRRRDPKKEEEERLEWKRFQQSTSIPQPKNSQSRRSTEDVKGEVEDRQKVKNADTEEKLPPEKQECEKSRNIKTWELYETAWSKICSPGTSEASLRFRHLPWPIMDIFIKIPAACAIGDDVIDLAFSSQSISSFLFLPHHSNGKSKKRRLHEALLRYHPDRFEHRILRLVVEKERVAAKQAARRITNVLNSLLNAC